MTAGTGKPSRRESGPPPSAAPHAVRRPVNIHHWEDISFLHWGFDPDEVAPLLPAGTTVLTHGGRAWVGVTPFFMRVRPPGLPVLPGGAFPETNVRTYVAGPDGRQGLCFLRMEVTAPWFVAGLRSLGLPYVRQRMSVGAEGERVSYTSRARPSTSEGNHTIVVRPGEVLDPPSGGPRERFLTARWGAYHRRGPVLLYTPVHHSPWTLHAATVETCEVDTLFQDAGLPVPTGEPLVHYSPGVEVTVGRPRRQAG